MKLYQWDRIEIEQLNPLCGRQAIHAENLTVARIHLDKGAVVPEHRHVNEQITMLQSGRLRFLVDGRDVVLEPGEALVLEPDVPHRVEALENSLAIDLFSPAREDWKRGDDAYLRAPATGTPAAKERSTQSR
jgi:quercetin dioxygenase-like cupin family protein